VRRYTKEKSLKNWIHNLMTTRTQIEYPCRAVQVDPVKPALKPAGSKCLILKRDILLSTFAFKINLRRYTPAAGCRRTRGCTTGRSLHSFPFPLNLSVLCPFPLNSSSLVPHVTQINPWMCPEGAQLEP